MALDRLTKVDGGGISTTSDYRVGIITASKFVGPFDGTGGNFSGVVTATSANFTGNVTIGGTLTYEDVTNIDSVGIITARNGIDCNGDIDVDGHTNLDNVSIAGVTTGTIFKVPDSTGSDSSGATNNLSIGTGSDLKLFHNGSHTYIRNTTGVLHLDNYDGDIKIRPKNSEDGIKVITDGAVELYHDNNKIFNTMNTGVQIYGAATQGAIYLHNRSGTQTGIINANDSGQYFLQHGNNEIILKSTENSSVELYHNNSKKLETKGYGIDITGGFITTGGSIVQDGGNIKFGTGSDLQIFHDNSNNINVIQCHNGRTLHIDKDNGAENMAKFIPDGAVELYHNNAKKLETTSSGTELTGQLQVLYNGATASSIDGTVDIRSVGSSALLVGSTNAQGALIKIDGGANGDGASGDYVRIRHMSNGVCYFDNLHTAREITFRARGEVERLKITSTGHIEIPADNAYLRIGASADLELFHDNNGDSYITNDTGHLTIRNNTSGKVINLQPKSGANGIIARYEGAAELYHNNSKRFETTSTGFDGSGSSFNLQTSDSGAVNLRLQNSSTGTGTNDGFLIQLDSNEDGYIWHRENQNIIFGTADTTRWKITNAGHLVPGTPGSYDIGSTSLEIGNVYIANNKRLYLGTNQSFSAYNDGSGNTIFTDANNFYLKGNSVYIQANQSEPSAYFLYNGAVKLYYDGGTYSTPKLQTTATGISVHGEVAASQDYPNFRPTLDLNFVAEKKLDPRITYTRTGSASFVNEFRKVVLVGDNTPRFDHDPVTRECKGLLIEESRTNKVNYSESLATGWSLNNSATRYKNDVVAPDGVLYTNASTGGSGVWEIVETSSSTTHLVYQQLSGSDSPNSTACTISAFAKPGLNRTHFVLTEGNTLSATAIFDVANGTVTSTVGTGSPTAKIEGPFFNGWYRCSLTYITASTQNYINIQLGVAQNGTTVSYAGDGSSSIAVWGIQHEVGSFSTSYIRSMDGSATTRGYEAPTLEGTEFSDVFGTEFKEFSLVADYDNTQTNDGTNYAIIDLWGEATGYDDRIEWFKLDSSPYHIETRSFGGGNPTFANGDLSASSKAKSQRFATSWYVPDYSNTSSRRFVVSMGGEAVDVISDGSGTTVPQITRMGIGCNPTRLDFKPGLLHFKRLMVYNKTLSDGQLQNLSAQ